MSETRAFAVTLPGEWYWLAHVFQWIVMADPDADTLGRKWLSGPHAAFGARWEAFQNETTDTVGTITFNVGTTQRETVVQVAIGAPEYEKWWYDRFNQLYTTAREVSELRATHSTTPDEAIEHYYRSRAAGSRITLRQIAEDTNLSYEALRKHKQRYDARGGWGAKVKVAKRDTHR